MTSIAVVIPSHDRRSLLRRAVASVGGADQVIVVDDASSSYTPSFVDELRARRVDYVRLETHRGVAHARNVGVGLVTSDVVLFLDDDDYVLEGGLDRIRRVADHYPRHRLYLHNCTFSDGGTSLESSTEAREISFEDWVRLLANEARSEFKPVVRIAVFDDDRFDDVAAATDGLLWARVIRDSGAVLSHTPVVYYDNATDRPRITSPTELLASAPAMAYVARTRLDVIGPTMRTISPRGWERIVLSAVVYSKLARDRRPLDVNGRVSRRTALLVRLIKVTPRPVLAIAFRRLKGRF